MNVLSLNVRNGSRRKEGWDRLKDAPISLKAFAWIGGALGARS